MSSSHSVSIPTPDGPVPAVVHLPERTPAPVVVCCHGLLSYKDSSKFVAIGEQYSSAGMVVVRFDFSGCGESTTIQKESLLFSRMRDLQAVLDYAQHQPWANGTIGLLGSSLGGYLSLLTAASEPHLIQAVVCWATPFDLSRIKLALSESDELKQSFLRVSRWEVLRTLEIFLPFPASWLFTDSRTKPFRGMTQWRSIVRLVTQNDCALCKQRTTDCSIHVGAKWP